MTEPNLADLNRNNTVVHNAVPWPPGSIAAMDYWQSVTRAPLRLRRKRKMERANRRNGRR